MGNNNNIGVPVSSALFLLQLGWFAQGWLTILNRCYSVGAIKLNNDNSTTTTERKKGRK